MHECPYLVSRSGVLLWEALGGCAGSSRDRHWVNVGRGGGRPVSYSYVEVTEEVWSFGDHVFEVCEGEFVVSVEIGLLHDLLTDQRHLLRAQLPFGQLHHRLMQVLLTDEVIPVIIVDLESVDGLELSGRGLTQNGKHVDEVIKTEVSLAVLRESLHDTVPKRVLLEFRHGDDQRQWDPDVRVIRIIQWN